MRAGKSALAVTVLLFASSSQNSLAEQSQMGIEIFNSSIQGALENYDTLLREPKNILELSSGGIVRSCMEYLAHTPPRAIAEGINNQTIYQEYLVCDTIEAIQDRASGYEHTSPPMNRGKTIAERLDLRSFLSSMGPGITDDEFTLSTLATNDVSMHENSVEIDSENWFYKLEVVAAGDFNSNNEEDWLIRLADESKDGNYRGYSALLVYDPGFARTIKATHLPQP